MVRQKSRNDLTKQRVVLAVGNASEWHKNGRALPWDAKIYFTAFAAINANLIQRINPEGIYSPLLSSKFDCLDVVQRLRDANFTGRYRIMTVPIANPAMILNEARGLYPGLDIDFIFDTAELDHGSIN